MATVSEIKKELEKKDNKALFDYCLRLIKYKKENKELIAYLLFESDQLQDYLEKIKQETDDLFLQMNSSNLYFIKKSIRKILRNINKHIRFISSKQAEAELLIYFCNCMKKYAIPMKRSRQLMNLYEAQLKKIELAVSTLHPDLQYDLRKEILK